MDKFHVPIRLLLRTKHYTGIIVNLITNKIFDKLCLGHQANKTIKSTREGATLTQSIDYLHFREIFKSISINDQTIIAEVGCGQGRIIGYLLKKGVTNEIIGYEINEYSANQTRKCFSTKQNVTIKDDIFDDDNCAADLFILNNPFTPRVLVKFVDWILTKDKNWTFIYASCYASHLEVLKLDTRLSIEIISINREILGINNKTYVIAKRA